MEFYEELFLTAFISILIAFLIGKIAAAGPADDADIDCAGPAEAVAVAHAERKMLDPPELGLVAGGAEKEVTVENLRDGDDILSREIEVERERLMEKKLGRRDEAVRDFGFDLVEEEDREQKIDSGVGQQELEEIPHMVTDKELDNEVKIEKVEEDFVEEEEKQVEFGRIAEEVREEVADENVEEAVQSEKVDDETVPEEAITEEEQREGVDKKAGSLLHGEDEWEGIERSELEKLFGVATEYVTGEKGAQAVSKLSNEVQMQLLGLQKVAIEGPCYEPQPMALKISARAKWNAWQRLGSLNPEAAMEQYISLLTDCIPGWTGEMPGGEVKINDDHDPPTVGLSPTEARDSTSSLDYEPYLGNDRLDEDASDIQSDIDNVAAGPNLLKQGLTKTFLFNLLSPTRVAFMISYL